MSYILRTCIKHSIKQRTISSLNSNYKILFNKYLPCLNHVAQEFQNASSSGKSSTLKYIFKKLYQDAKKFGCVYSKDVENILEEIKQTRSITDRQSLTILDCCGNLMIDEIPLKRMQLGMEIWKILAKLDINLRIEHYNNFIKVQLDNNYPFSPASILKELHAKKLEPTSLTYELLITRYCQIGDIAGANKILKLMKKKEFQVNSYVFNSLILGHSAANDMPSAERVVDVMIEAGISPTSETFVNLMHGYLKQRNLNKFYELYKKYYINFHDTDFLEVIYNLAVYGYDKEIDKILEKIIKNINYSVETKNYINRLLTIDKIDIAFKLLKTLGKTSHVDGTFLPIGDFFIEDLIRRDIPLEKILKYCDELMEKGLNHLALSVAMRSSLRYNKENTALRLFRIAKERNMPLRSHYFWPLLAFRGQKQDITGIFTILDIMGKEFGIVPNAGTIRDYVIPYTLKSYTSIERLLQDLKSHGIFTSTAVSSIVLNLLNESEIRKAAEVASNYNAFYPSNLIREPLVANYVQSKDLLSFVTLLKQINAGLLWRNSTTEDVSKIEDEDYELPEHYEFIGQIVNNAVNIMKRDSNADKEIENLLAKLLESGIGIGPRSADHMQNILENKFTQRISELLKQLTDNAISKSWNPSENNKNYVISLDENTLEQLNKTMKTDEEFANGIKRQLFMTYCRNHNINKLLKLKEELENDENFVITNAMYACLVEICVDLGKFDEAVNEYNFVRKKNPNFNLRSVKSLKFSLMLVKNGQYDNAFEVLNTNQEMENESERNFICWSILNEFAEKGDADRVQRFFDLFIARHFVRVNNIVLGPLIKVHLVRNDLEKAMHEFEKCSAKYNLTPLKFELIGHFIDEDDTKNIQRITEISSEIHGKINSLFDLMLSFLERNRIKEAEKIVKDSDLRVRPDRLRGICSKYTKDGSVNHLKNLLRVLKYIKMVDPSIVYNDLLQLYDKQNNAKEALALWEQMQAEDVTPHVSFLTLLADILKRNNVNVFVVHEEKEEQSARAVRFKDKSILEVSRADNSRIDSDRPAENVPMANRDKSPLIEKITDSRSESDSAIITQLLVSMDKALKRKNLSLAKEIFEELSSRGILPHRNVLKDYVTFLMKAGQVEEIEKMENLLSKDMKKLIKYDNKLCKTYSIANRDKEYFTKLETKLDSIRNEFDLEWFLNKFPKGGLISIMCKKQALFPQVKRILDKIMAKTDAFIFAPNLIWMYYMLIKDFEEAERIFELYLRNCNKAIMFKKLTTLAAEKFDIKLANTVLNMLKSKPDITPSNLGHAYSTVISIKLEQNKVEEAFDILQEALERLSMEHIEKLALTSLKEACADKGISFAEFETTKKQFECN